MSRDHEHAVRAAEIELGVRVHPIPSIAVSFVPTGVLFAGAVPALSRRTSASQASRPSWSSSRSC